jgi:hypothetical protein
MGNIFDDFDLCITPEELPEYLEYLEREDDWA